MPNEKVAEFLSLLDRVEPESPPVVKVEIFTFIRGYWAESGEDPELAEKVCKKLGITRGTFELWLESPELIYGIENLHRYLKPGSWLRQYLDYTSGHEAPEEFHLWVGMTILGAVLRRKVWFDNVYYRLFPNIYCVLISPPAVCKKSTCIDIGIRLLRAAVTDIAIVSEKITPEAIFVALAKPRAEKKADSDGTVIRTHAHGLFNAPELTVFLGREAYNEGLIILLTRLYDCPDVIEYSTRVKGTLHLKDVFVSLLGATTPSEIAKAIPESATGGGFISRVTFVHRDVPTRMFAFPSMSDPTLRELLVAELTEIASHFAGGFILKEDAQEWYKRFYKEHKENLSKKSAAGERQPDLLLKVAMILCASENSGLEITVEILARAHKIILSVEKGIEGTLRMVSSSESGRMSELIINTIKKNGGTMKHSSLLKKLYGKMSSREVAMCMDTLREADILVKEKAEGGSYYRLVKE